MKAIAGSQVGRSAKYVNGTNILRTQFDAGKMNLLDPIYLSRLQIDCCAAIRLLPRTGDVGLLKLFLTTKFVDISKISQDSPFDKTRGIKQMKR